MKCTGHVARMREMANAYKLLRGKSEGKPHLGDPGVGGRTEYD
jgi:hypothetical protein